MIMAQTTILFLCIENSNRSQMAEAFANKYAAKNITIFSAGSKPGGHVNQRAIQFMAERGFNLNTHRSLAINALPISKFDYVISMGCGDDCPVVPTTILEDWQIPDPKALDDESFRIIRDYIGIKVLDLIKRIQL